MMRQKKKGKKQRTFLRQQTPYVQLGVITLPFFMTLTIFTWDSWLATSYVCMNGNKQRLLIIKEYQIFKAPENYQAAVERTVDHQEKAN